MIGNKPSNKSGNNYTPPYLENIGFLTVYPLSEDTQPISSFQLQQVEIPQFEQVSNSLFRLNITNIPYDIIIDDLSFIGIDFTLPTTDPTPDIKVNSLSYEKIIVDPKEGNTSFIYVKLLDYDFSNSINLTAYFKIKFFTTNE